MVAAGRERYVESAAPPRHTDDNQSAFQQAQHQAQGDCSLEDDDPEPGDEMESGTIELGGGTARESDVNFDLEENAREIEF